MTTQTATHQKFEVTGSVKFQINAKNKFFTDEIVKLEADLFIGNKTHLLIADEKIEVEWKYTNSKIATGILTMPIIFHAKVNSEEKAISHAYSILNNDMDKIEATIEFIDETEHKFTAKNNILVEWSQAKKVNLK